MPRILIIGTNSSPFIEDPIIYLSKKFEVDILYINSLISLRGSKERMKIESIRGFPALTNNYVIKKIQASINYKIIENHLKHKNIDYDLVHGHFLHPTGYFLDKLKKKFNKKIIITGHGSDVYHLPFISNHWNNEIRKILYSVDHLITVCNNNRDILVKNDLILPEKLTVIYNGFDEKKFYPARSTFLQDRYYIEDNKKILLSIGRYSREKGHEFLINAMIKLKDYGFVLFLVGEGPMRRRYLTLIKQYNLNKYVFLLGWIRSEELNVIINSADYIVQPSLQEGFPTVLPEVLACGKPVISTPVGGIPEIITPENGVLFSDLSTAEIINGINRATNINFNQNEICRNALSNFSYSIISEKLNKIYFDHIN